MRRFGIEPPLREAQDFVQKHLNVDGSHMGYRLQTNRLVQQGGGDSLREADLLMM